MERDGSPPARLFADPLIPRGQLVIATDPANLALCGYWMHPVDWLWAKYGHSPVLSRKTLGHREMDRDRRRHRLAD
jgi:hypothetical protein